MNRWPLGCGQPHLCSVQTGTHRVPTIRPGNVPDPYLSCVATFYSNSEYRARRRIGRNFGLLRTAGDPGLLPAGRRVTELHLDARLLGLG